jgi:tellurite resistance protein
VGVGIDESRQQRPAGASDDRLIGRRDPGRVMPLDGDDALADDHDIDMVTGMLGQAVDEANVTDAHAVMLRAAMTARLGLPSTPSRSRMFRRIFGSGPDHEQAADTAEAALTKAAATTGQTETVQHVVAQLESLPPERARLVASAAYTLARAAQADLDISDDEMAIIQDALQTRGALDESTAHLVAELVKLQARTVGGTEDYVVVREFAAIANDQQKQDILRACFLVSAANGSISAEESAEVNQIANELGLDPAVVSGIRAEFHERLSAVQAVRRAAEGG